MSENGEVKQEVKKEDLNSAEKEKSIDKSAGQDSMEIDSHGSEQESADSSVSEAQKAPPTENNEAKNEEPKSDVVQESPPKSTNSAQDDAPASTPSKSNDSAGKEDVEMDGEKNGGVGGSGNGTTNGDDYDDDEEDIPISQWKKPTTVEKKSAKEESKSDDNEDDDDDEDDIPISQLKKPTKKKSTPRKAPAKKAPAPKKAPKKPAPKKKAPPPEDDDDDDDDDIPISQLKKPEAPPPELDDDDDDDDDIPISQLTSLKNAARTRRSQRNYEESSDEEEEEEVKKKKGGATKKKKGSSTRGSSTSASSKKKTAKKETTTKSSGRGVKKEAKGKEEKKVKEESRAEKKMREEEEARHKWWLETNDLAEDEKWKTLKHAGVLFAPLYVPHGVKPLYDGKQVDLSPIQEEYATYYAQYLETDHVKKEVFRDNFWNCWKKLLNAKKPHPVIKEFEKMNFRPIWSHLEKRKEERKNRTKDEKDAEKKEKAVIAEKYGFAELDGVRERVGNYRVEPPGLFLGRGAHPKAGMFKKRITPKDITINIGPGVSPPKPSEPYEDKEFENVISNNKVTWLATWRENVNGNTKYVMLHSSSRLKGEADMKKFEVARQLKDNVDGIRKQYMTNLTAKNPVKRQFATAMWVIDHLALRVGNEKGEDEADTVGCCSLRVEHIKLVPPSSIEFDFLGKDSMRYFNTVEVHPKVYDNFQKFINKKNPSDDVFELLNSVSLNAHLKKYMNGLSAKVFRTFNASFTLEKELEKVKMKKDATVEEKVFEFNKANREVAILCNHQRTQSKQHGVQMEKIDEKMEQIKEEIKEVKRHKKRLNEGKGAEEKETKSRKRKRAEEEEEAEEKPEKKKARMIKTPEKCDETAKRLQERLKKWELKKTEKDEMKTIALNTSKVNYIDPRLCVAWCKRNDVPVDKIFSKLLRDKFAWAMGVDDDWKF